jgi:hypothetical protein
MTNPDTTTNRTPGRDAQEISRVANDRYGGMEKMFLAHKWPERSSRMMTSVQRHVTEAYGSVEVFVQKHSKKK